MTFTCGCTDDGQERCAVHAAWCCHDGCNHMGPHFIPECPPCFLARIRSVGLSADATPTRRGK